MVDTRLKKKADDELTDSPFGQQEGDDLSNLTDSPFGESSTMISPRPALGGLGAVSNFSDLVERPRPGGYNNVPLEPGSNLIEGVVNFGRNAAQDQLSTMWALQAARLGGRALTAVNPVAGGIAQAASYAIPALAASSLGEWLTGRFVRPEEPTNFDRGANALGGALTARFMPPGAKTLIENMAGSVAQKGADYLSTGLKNRAAVNRLGALGATPTEQSLEVAGDLARKTLGLAEDAPPALINTYEESLKRLEANGFWQRNKATPVGVTSGIESEIKTVSGKLDSMLSEADRVGSFDGPEVGEMLDLVRNGLAPTLLNKEMIVAENELRALATDYAAAVRNGSLVEMNAFKRKLYDRANYEAEAAVDPVINMTRMGFAERMRELVSSKAKAALGSDAVDKLNLLDSDLLTIRPLATRFSGTKNTGVIESAIKGLGNSPITRTGSLIGGGYAGTALGLSPVVTGAALLGGGYLRSPAGQMLRGGLQESAARGAQSLAPGAGRVLSTGMETLPSVAVQNLIEGATGSADAQGMPVILPGQQEPTVPQENMPIVFPDSVKQMLAQQQGQGQPQGPSFLPEVPFANGLPRSTDGWNAQTLQVFLQRRMQGGPDPVAEGMAQKLEGAIHAQDESKAERIIADMAKLYPALFEPGMGVNNKIFHPDDQDEYLRLLKSSARNGRVDAIFLAKQRESFLDPNDSQILPIQEGLVGKIDSQLSQMSRRAPKKGAEAREYAY